VKHLHMKVVFVSAVCAHRFSCVLVSFPLVLSTGLCTHVDLTYWIVYKGLLDCAVAVLSTITVVDDNDDDDNITIHI